MVALEGLNIGSNMKKKIFLFIVFIQIIININAQNIDSLRVKRDSIPVKKESMTTNKDSLTINKASVAVAKDSLPLKKAKFLPVPKKALIYSIIPGGGQIYNRKLWYIKLPLVYGAFIGSGIAIQYNSSFYSYFKKNHYNKLNGIELDKSKVPNINFLSTDVLRQYRDSFYKSAQQSYVVFALVYILSAAEAFTTAHLLNFDVSEDLSFKLKPSFENLPIGNAFGIGIQASF